MTDFREAVRKASKIAGGQAKLAKAVGCAQSEISRLSTTASSISPPIAIAISKATGGEVRLADLLPDVVKAVAAELSATPEAAA